MNKDRDMFYNVYGYGGANPTINPIQGMVPGQMNPFMNHNELNTRLSNLENKIKVLESRIARLENPYNSNYNEPDSNMYMLWFICTTSR